jgi:hypothetical protein
MPPYWQQSAERSGIMHKSGDAPPLSYSSSTALPPFVITRLSLSPQLEPPLPAFVVLLSLVADIIGQLLLPFIEIRHVDCWRSRSMAGTFSHLMWFQSGANCRRVLF